MNTPPRLSMHGIFKSFGGVRVLNDVSLTVAPGEIVALLGSNGAGKSTLVKIFAGVYSCDTGTIQLDGETVSFSQPAESVAAGVTMLPQEVSVIPDMTVAENIYLGALPMRRRFGFNEVDFPAIREKARQLLEQLGFGGLDVGAVLKSLSVAEQRIVEIARAFASDARLLIMDEPTAALSEHEAQLIFRIIRRLKEEGVSIIYISHYMSEVFSISDRIVVLRDGRNAGDFVTANTDRAEVLFAMLGNVMGELYASGEEGDIGEPALSVERLNVAGRIEEASFTVRVGEILGIFGLVGSGIEVLGRAIYGALGAVDAGSVTLGGQAYRPMTPGHGKRAGIGFVAAERKKEGIFADLTVRENIALSFEDRFVEGLFVSRKRETDHARNWIRDLDIRTRGPEQHLRTLSGGNQQKVCIARWLVEGVRLLILEEPTRGVDVGARREIYGKLRELTGKGYAVLILSSDVEEVAGIGDRSLVLDRGKIVAEFAGNALPSQLMASTSDDPAVSAA